MTIFAWNGSMFSSSRLFIWFGRAHEQSPSDTHGRVCSWCWRTHGNVICIPLASRIYHNKTRFQPVTCLVGLFWTIRTMNVCLPILSESMCSLYYVSLGFVWLIIMLNVCFNYQSPCKFSSCNVLDLASHNDKSLPRLSEFVSHGG
jgi:hypothetical protein